MSPERVRFLHSAEWRSSPPEERIRLYREAVGLPAEGSTDEAKDHLEAHFPDELAAFIEAVGAAEGTNRAAVYEAKNVTLEFSLAMGAFGRGAFHRAMMECTMRSIPVPGKVLDAGCDNGILTCFYALLWPAAAVVGFDISSMGIVRAKELAASLQLSNITFLACSLELLATMPAQTGFDLVLTTTFLQEAGYFPPTPESTFAADIVLDDRLAECSAVYPLVANLMSTNRALWIGTEMLQKPHLLWHWFAAVQAAGLSIDPVLSRRVVCGVDFATVVVASKQVHAPVTALWAREFWNRASLPEWDPRTSLPVGYLGLEAQFIFDSITGKKLRAQALVWPEFPPDHPREAARVEIWTTDSLAIFHLCDMDMGVEIALNSLAALAEIRERWDAVAEGFEGSVCRSERWIDL